MISVDFQLPERAAYAAHRAVAGSHAGTTESLLQRRDRAFPRLIRVQLEADGHLVVAQQRRFHFQ